MYIKYIYFAKYDTRVSYKKILNRIELVIIVTYDCS